MVLLLALTLGTGFAVETARERVAHTAEAMFENSLSDAAERLKTAAAAIPESTQPVDAQTIAEMMYYQGLLPRLAGAERDVDLDAWRDALVVFPALEWNRALMDDANQQRVFEALRGEVKQREPVSTQVPEEAGATVMFVDGVRHMPDQAIRAGRHLAQIACPDGLMVGKWSRFERPIHWLKMCSGGVDLSAAPIPVAENDSFDTDSDPRQGPEPLAVSRVSEVRAKRSRWTMPFLASAGGAVLVSGVLYATALSSRAKYDDLDNPDVQGQADLDQLRKKTNTRVALSVSFGVAGAGLATAAAFSGRW